MRKYRSEKNCLNCGTPVEDRFCPHCGQENLELREPFWGFLMHSIGHYFHFDSKFLKSFLPLITKPGTLTKDFIAGKRASHIPPVTLYLFISFVFFIITISSDDNRHLDSAIKTEESIHQADSIKNLLKNSQQSQSETKRLSVELGKLEKKSKPKKPTFLFSKADTSFFKDKAAYDNYQKGLAQAKRDSWFVRFLSRKEIDINQKYGERRYEVLEESVRHNVPKMMFILMPLFALILSITFLKSKMYFIEHLVYTLHVHSFLFLLFGFSVVLVSLWDSLEAYVITAALPVSIWYIYRSMRVVYQQGRGLTLFKLSVLSLVYLMLMIVSLMSIVLFSIAVL